MSWFSKKPQESIRIPNRSESSYNGQYMNSIDIDRLTQIFEESAKIAVESRKPDTAHGRYELAIEVYHQMKSLKLTRKFRNSLDNAMQTLVRNFPSQVCMNEALGLCDKADKVKTIKTQLKHLRNAKQVLEEGLTKHDVGYERIMSIYTQVNDYVTQAEKLAEE